NFLCDCDGILVPGGFGGRAIEGKLQAIRYARCKNIPFFGICLYLGTSWRYLIGMRSGHGEEVDRFEGAMRTDS
ncbi:MAG: hypothetical protein Q8765_02410, partial [Sweet potato little leaf phytoplasma]|nr:hypothetical protein [Sweet potato little leaf phytoplasma]